MQNCMAFQHSLGYSNFTEQGTCRIRHVHHFDVTGHKFISIEPGITSVVRNTVFYASYCMSFLICKLMWASRIPK